MNIPEPILKLIREKDVKTLCKVLFKGVKPAQELTKTQETIVRKIAYGESKRLAINCYTRYGKSQCVAIGVALYILFHTNKRILLIAPQREQTDILRTYVAELIASCPLLDELVEINVKRTAENLAKEASKKRLTFRNGCVLMTQGAYGEAKGLMGFGGDLIIIDESALISRSAHTKIFRMLGDDAKNAVMVELANPWDRDTKYYDHYVSSRYETIHVDWRVGIEEGRITKEFIDEAKEEMTTLEFQVLYESRFPDQSEDSIFNLVKINEAEQREFNLTEGIDEAIKIIKNATKYPESVYLKAKRTIKEITFVIGCDPADKGKDETVMYWGWERGNKKEVIGAYSEPKTESMELVGRWFKKIDEYTFGMIKAEIRFDRIAIGTGPLSRAKERIRDENRKNVRILGCHFGEKALNPDRFKNKKAENYFRLQSLLNEGLISIPENCGKVKRHLLAMKWKLTSSSLIIIEDPEGYSPDWADALVYFGWRDNSQLAFIVG